MKQITIYEFLERNKEYLVDYKYVAYDKGWWAYKEEPAKGDSCWIIGPRNMICLVLLDNNIAPFDGDWKDSLIKVEHKCSSSGQVKEPSINIEDFASPHPTGFMSESQLKRMFEHKEEE